MHKARGIATGLIGVLLILDSGGVYAAVALGGEGVGVTQKIGMKMPIF